MSLDEYNRKRDFSKTSEPRGAPAPKPGDHFVIQKHDARTLHYDLRLEIDGVLKSWAVPKGPSENPDVKRLAIETEDHPLSYLRFEGVIPAGEYGGGTVMVWDIGSFEVLKGDHAAGKLTFVLHGGKLNGSWRLIRTNRGGRSAKHWLLSKVVDESVRNDGLESVDESPLSVLSNRSMEEIANARDSVWQSGSDHSPPAVSQEKPSKKETPKKPSGKQSSPKKRSTDSVPEMENRIRTFLSRLAGTPEDTVSPEAAELTIAVSQTSRARTSEMQPSSMSPMLPATTRQPPEGNEWVHEIKYDGYRMLCRIDNGNVRLFSRNGKDWTDKLTRMAAHLAKLPIEQGILDGEVAAVTSDGLTDFQRLQTLIGNGDDRTLRYYAFDLIYANGYDLGGCTLLDRKRLLRSIVPEDHAILQYSEHIAGQGKVVFAQASKLGTEGIVSKRIASRYVLGRTEEWVKTKCLASAEFVVGAYTLSDTKNRGIAALVLGRYESGRLIYEGRVGTGFTASTLRDLEQRLNSIEIEECPFHDRDRLKTGRVYRWVDPQLVVEVEYGGWTKERVLRFPSYRGIRPEIDPQDLVRIPSDESAPDETDDSNEDVATKEEPPTNSGSSKLTPPFAVDLDSLSSFRLTHPERVVYPHDGVTKLGLATYFGRIAGWMLPHLANRPLALVRCPKGTEERCFFQKKPIKGMPPSIHSPEVAVEGRTPQNPPMIDDLEGLIALIQFGTIEIHTWGCLADRPDRPDMITFDLDPDASLSFNKVADAALTVRHHLRELGLESFVKTTGGKGLHVIVPIQRRTSWEDVKTLCDAVSQRMLIHSPSRFTTSPSKQARVGKIYIDTLRNRFGATSIAPFSTRVRERATVSMPLDWNEVPALVAANGFTIDNVFSRIDHLAADPWRDFYQAGQGITKALLKRLPAWIDSD